MRIRTVFRNPYTVLIHRHPEGVVLMLGERPRGMPLREFWAELVRQRLAHRRQSIPYQVYQAWLAPGAPELEPMTHERGDDDAA